LNRKYDLLIRGGVVIDPSQNLHESADVALRDGRIEAVGRDISEDLASTTIDARHKMILPGFIDLHVHVYEGVSEYGINVDAHCLKDGSTTVVDAGSSGADTFPGLRKYVVMTAQTRVLAMLNISSIGLISLSVGELENLRYVDVQKTTRICEENRDVIVGIKVRMSRHPLGNSGLRPLKMAREAADAIQRPMMVHIGDSPVPLADILAEMKKGDVLTHCFTGRPPGILGPDGTVVPEARDALKRGVVFDVGHGGGSFSFDVARLSLEQGVEPNTISSDLHTQSVGGPAFNLTTTISKFLHLGLSIEDVIAKVTTTPASFLGMQGRIGTLRVGAYGDLVVLDREEGEFILEDCHAKKEVAKQKLRVMMVVKGGKVCVDDFPEEN
jgi:dihydroorotase